MNELLIWVQQNQGLLGQLGLFSAVSGIVGVIGLPLLIVYLPADYLIREKRPARERHPILKATFLAAKNLIGISCIIFGILLLVLPGQGIVTILIGLALTDMPGKDNLLHRIAGNRPVAGFLNRIRRRASKAPFEMPPNHVSDVPDRVQ